MFFGPFKTTGLKIWLKIESSDFHFNALMPSVDAHSSIKLFVQNSNQQLALAVEKEDLERPSL